MSESPPASSKAFHELKDVGLSTSAAGGALLYLSLQLQKPLLAAGAGLLFGWGTALLGVQYALRRSIIDE